MDRELQPGDRPRLEAHLRQCASCRASAEAHRLQDADLRQAFAGRRRASSAVAERVIAHLRTKPAHRRRHLPWLTVILSAAAGFLIAALLFRPWTNTVVPVGEGKEEVVRNPETPQPETILFALATGPVQTCEIQAPGEAMWKVLEMGGRIVLGTRVRTKPDVRCEFRTRDGSEVRVNGDSELVFTEGRRLEMDKGQILARVMEASAPFQVGIPQATVTALGTEFDVLCKPVETVLTVLDGATKVVGKDHWYTVQTGEQATIKDGLLVRKQFLQRYRQVASWTDALLRMKGPSSREANQRMSAVLDDLLIQLGSAKGELSDDEIRSLGPQIVLPLTRYVQSERSKLPQERNKRHRSAHILADMAQPWSVPDLIELLGDADNQVRFYAAVGLKRLTKETLGREPEEWRKKSLADLKAAREEWRQWWLKNKGRFPDTSLSVP
jgi:ferric-dicitrate binding protein FerR (iron transport regulator)